jgi:hypothetical protein
MPFLFVIIQDLKKFGKNVSLELLMAKRILLYIYFFLFLTTFTFSQKFEKIDKHALNAPEEATQTISTLAEYLTKPATNEVEEVRSFYIWIAENIAYNTSALISPNEKPQLPEEILKSRKAVCQGYSELFKALCKEVEISAYVVSGYSKGYGYSQGKKFLEEDHAWNVVKVDNEWKLLDVTWGAGYITPTKTFEKSFNEKYFLTDSQNFVLDHLPLDPMWQLLDCPIPMSVYEKETNVIQQALKKKNNCINYHFEIEIYEELPESERELYIAQRAYQSNPYNHRIIGYAYMNKGYYLANSLILQNNIQIERLNLEQEILKNYEQAISFLRLSKSPETKNLILNCNYNIAVSKNNIKIMRKTLGIFN